MKPYTHEERDLMAAAEAKAFDYLTKIKVHTRQSLAKWAAYKTCRAGAWRGDITGDQYMEACREWLKK